MDVKNELVSCFEFMNLKLEPKVLSKCEELCKKYDIEPEEFCNVWCAYAASTACTDAPTLEKLEVVERKELQKLNKEKQFPRTPKSIKVETTSKDDSNEFKGGEKTLSSHNDSNNSVPVIKKEEVEDDITDLPDQDFLDEFLETQISSTQNITKYADRTNSLRPKLQVGNNTEFQVDNDRIVSISLLNEENTLTSGVKYMYEVLGQKVTCLTNIANWIGTNIVKKNNIMVSTDVNTKNYIGPIVTYGRIFNEGRGQFDAQSIMLEGTVDMNHGQCVQLNIDKVHGTALFPGQIVAVKGKMLGGNKLIAENLYTDGSCVLPPEPAVCEDPIRIIAAAGPFTLDGDIKYDPMGDLINYVISNEPHVLILMGPFVDENHPIISKGDLPETFDVFFESLIGSISVALEDTSIQIVVISSMKDVHHYKVYPTPPYGLKKKYSNVKYFPDPCMLKIDEVVLGVTTADVMYHIAKEEVVTSDNKDTLARLASHIIQQRCFYPLYPPSNELNVSYEFLESHGLMECIPHMLILPSKFKTFAKNIHGCVVLNPERLTKGNNGGAFADITILPGVTPLVERLNCKIFSQNQETDYSYEPCCRYYSYQSKCCTKPCPCCCCNWVCLLLFILFVLILMGLIKGLIGLLYCSCVGSWGLSMLIDLPRPLPHYQEPCLNCREVVYDEAGWPVHPDTGERTVQVLTRQTEFFLNVIFFIAYPLALTLKLLEMACCIRSSSKNDEKLPFKQVNVIKMMEGCICPCQTEKTGPVIDIYQEGDNREDKDTEYVVEILKESKHSLRGSFCGFH